MNTSLPPFVLCPWEFEGAPHSPLADATVFGDWEGVRHAMRLKVRENLLFFAPQGCDQRLYALSIPLDESAERADEWKTRPEELEKLFAREYAKGRWGRIVVLPEEAKVQTAVALVDNRGGGWVRPLFSDHVQKVKRRDFVEGGHSLVVSEEEKPLKVLLASKWEETVAASQRREISAAARKRARINPQWVHGSLAELREALEAAIGAFPLPVRRRYGPSPRVLTRSAVRPARLDWMGAECSPQLEKIGDLLLQIHSCVGQSLDDRGYFFEPYFVVEVKTDSMHERMEAMLHLRELMRGTTIEAQIMEILQALL